ncbi:hypothetical protein HPB52_003963 [Rhipicephalus sanguineus]|uniref:Uncharacterized protein n=1 Tax=Rhipicephalus sanguineus TaxID=34632 RepID=A0A9D4SSC7_RHISA|nr:hypothetical protein HPB52_003963 [Rhipicephalus sanguineus]
MIESIVKMKPPADLTKITRFLGTTNLVSRFIPNYGKIAEQKNAKEADPYNALLAHRTTPLEVGYSPGAELLLGRRVCTTVLVSPHMLEPRLAESQGLLKTERGIKRSQKRNHNHRREGRDLKRRGTVLRQADSPRPYWIQCETGSVRHNRKHLIKDSAGVALDSHPASLRMPSCFSAEAPGMKQPGMTQSTSTVPSPYVTAHGITKQRTASKMTNDCYASDDMWTERRVWPQVSSGPGFKYPRGAGSTRRHWTFAVKRQQREALRSLSGVRVFCLGLGLRGEEEEDVPCDSDNVRANSGPLRLPLRRVSMDP